MSKEQITRYMVIHKSQEGQISVKAAAAALNLSERQVIRLRKGVSINGAQALIHKNQGRPPAHKTTEEVIKAIISHKSSDNYKDSNFKHFQESLAEHEKIEVSYSLIHRLLTQAGIQSPKKRRWFKQQLCCSLPSMVITHFISTIPQSDSLTTPFCLTRLCLL